MSNWGCRGVRGAITVERNEAECILAATRELLGAMVLANEICADDVASAIFSVTPDLNATFPAIAARQLGWRDVALFDTLEIGVPGALPRCLRILIHWNTSKPAREIRHIYLGAAQSLRPDRLGSSS